MGSTDLGQHRSDGRALQHGPVAGNETRQVARASYSSAETLSGARAWAVRRTARTSA